MKFNVALNVLVLMLTLAGLSPGARAQTRELSSTGELLDGIVAIVNDGAVLKSELQSETDSIVARLQKQGKIGRAHV